MKKISKNNRILVKSITSSEQYMITVDFDKCNIFLFNFSGILKKTIRFNRFKKELKVIRFAKLIDRDLFILSRNNQPIWIYNFDSKKLKDTLNSVWVMINFATQYVYQNLRIN